jgi:diguanylate cyclase (GGDEF)-like protein
MLSQIANNSILTIVRRNSTVREFAKLRQTWFVAVFFVILLTLQVAGFAILGPDRFGHGLSESVLLIHNFLALACAWIAFRRAQGVSALFWILFAAVMLVLLVPTGFQAYDTLFDQRTLSVSTWRLLYCLYGAPILMILFLPEAYQQSRLKSEIFLDLFQIAIVVSLIYSTFFFLPAQRMLPAEALLHNISISDKQSLILLAAAVVRLQFVRVASSRNLLVRLTIFLLVCAIATFIGDWLDLHHYASASAWFDLGWAIPHVAAGLLAITWVPSADAEPKEDRANFFSFLVSNLVLVAMLSCIFLLMNKWKQAYGEVLTDLAIAASLLAFTFRLAFTQFHQQQEILERKVAQEEASASHKEVALLLDDARRQTDEMVQISKLGSLLQVCTSREEVFRLIPERLRRLFPGASGAISLLNPSGVCVQPVAEWGIRPSDQLFAPEQCWALRSHRIHIHDGRSSEPRCAHLMGAGASVCIPLITNARTIGTLAIQEDDFPSSPSTEEINQGGFARRCQLAAPVAEQVTLTIANLDLRETLRLQAVRDELTGLYNRRYSEEFLDRALQSARRKHSSLSLLLIDLDHFKRHNDKVGHAAGERILSTVGEILRRCVRAEEVACRYGGDEFFLVLPDSTLIQATDRAEQIRARLKEHQTDSASMGKLPTVSIAVAAYDETTDRADLLLNFAEYALYLAKRNGRDRVVVARPAVSLPTSEVVRTGPVNTI